jgi:hypothetical protein
VELSPQILFFCVYWKRLSLECAFTAGLLLKQLNKIHGEMLLRCKLLRLGMVIISLLCFSLVSSAKAASMQSRTYGRTGTNYSKSVIDTSNEDTHQLATPIPLDVGTDFLVIKINSFGNIQWKRTYAGAESDIAESLVATPDEGLYSWQHQFI